MALWDSPYLLEQAKLLRSRPGTDERTSDAQWYTMLTLAEAHWKPIVAAVAPGEMFSAPVQMTTSDAGATYILPSSEVDPISLRVFTSSDLRTELFPGAESDLSKDYTHDSGGTIRMIGGARTFSDGPYARFVAGPTTVNASTESTILPKRARILLVYFACALDASRGGMDDPAFYRALEQKAWTGDPLIDGDIGIKGSLMMRDFYAGVAATRGDRWKARWMYPNG